MYSRELPWSHHKTSNGGKQAKKNRKQDKNDNGGKQAKENRKQDKKDCKYKVKVLKISVASVDFFPLSLY